MPNSHGNKLYIGLDGGQSETFAVICGGDGKLLGTGRSGGCILGSALCGDNIAAAVSEALAEAGLAADTIFNGAVFGLSGGFDMINIGDYVCARNKKAVWDAEIALAGAAGGAAPDDSALIIAGTGSVAIGKPFGGGFTRCGGWGYVLHDPGSGCEIGRQVFEAAVRDTDGRGPKTALTGLLLSHFGADNLLEVKKLTYECNPLHVFPPLAAIFETACIMGDSEALRIGYKAGEELAALAVGLTVKGGVAKNCRVYRTGGMFYISIIATSFETALKSMLPEAKICECLLPPCLGAVLMAADGDTEMSDKLTFASGLMRSADEKRLKGNL